MDELTKTYESTVPLEDFPHRFALPKRGGERLRPVVLLGDPRVPVASFAGMEGASSGPLWSASRRPLFFGAAAAAVSLVTAVASAGSSGVIEEAMAASLAGYAVRPEGLMLAVVQLVLLMASFYGAGTGSVGKPVNRQCSAMLLLLIMAGGSLPSANALSPMQPGDAASAAYVSVKSAEDSQEGAKLMESADSQLNESHRKLLQYTVMPGPPSGIPTPSYDGVSDADQTPYMPQEFMAKEAKMVRMQTKMEKTLET